MTRRADRLLLVTLVLLTAVTGIVSSLGAPLVPAIADAYDVPLTAAQWALTATLLTGAVATPVLGRLGHGRRRKPVIVGALAAVTAGTVAAAASFGLGEAGFGVLLAGRALQGLGLALVPLAMAVARDAVPAPRLPSAVAVLSVSVVAGAGLGYPLTALVAERVDLAAAYWLGAALTALTLALTLCVVPPSPDADHPPLDLPGAAILGAGLMATLLAISQAGSWGWPDARTIGLGTTGPLLLLAWVLWSLRTEHPLVDLRLAVRPGVLAPNLTGVAAGAGMYVLLSLSIVLAQADPAAHDGWGLGVSVTLAAALLVPYSLGSVGGSRVALVVRRAVGARWLLPIGCGLFLTATSGLALAHDHGWQALLWMSLGGLGSGFTFSSLAVLMMPHLPREETATALALNQVLRYLGYTAGSSLGVALMAAGGPGSASESGFRLALLSSAGVFVVTGAVTWWLGRGPRPTPALHPPH